MAEDRFSQQSKVYAQFRPEYPKELFEFLGSLCKSHRLAWDCATGTGQAARSLSPLFEKVIATDLSAEQISHARAPTNVEFKVAQAEEVIAADSTVDLVTVAQALHWFDFEVFYSNVKKALTPNGIFAAWGYSFFRINSEIDQILDPYGREFLAPYWSAKNWLLINGYKEIPFPFKKLKTPKFDLTVYWNLGEVQGFLESWSATQKYREAHGKDPILNILQLLKKAWGEEEIKKKITWDLHLLAGMPY
jgi:SAM-dependent methyltransferase